MYPPIVPTPCQKGSPAGPSEGLGLWKEKEGNFPCSEFCLYLSLKRTTDVTSKPSSP